ncbi:hypothetical protein F4780DRAFT_768869 [Xylariomycetidae sp. FL0641]|nr:hypothetical protein F4780DRAFT_768869 [Xylariomycetidae sp. FL0641]
MALSKTPGLLRLPYELVSYVVHDLDIDDIFGLSLCCHHFAYLAREERICKAILMAKAPYSKEAQSALEGNSRFSTAFRRRAKIRQAFSQASPYLVATVGVADAYQFVAGKLCYIIEDRPNSKRWLRVLDLYGASDTELVVDIPELIRRAVPSAAKSRKYKFRILYHACGVTSCLFSFALPLTENWLLIFKPEKQQIVQTHRLESAARIFVRNNADFLYYGTHSEEGADGRRKWVIQGFDLRKCCWFPRKVHLSNLVGYDIGLNVCFEIFDGYFYGLSNQTAFEIEEVDWTSFYYCFRFPLEDPTGSSGLQTMEKQDSWRRQHSEGPLDDRWGFLALERDDASGNIVIVESRKEWRTGRSGSQRIYYTKEVFFRSAMQQDSGEDRPGTTERQPANLMKQICTQDTFQQRSPHTVHLGDDSAAVPMFTRTKTHLCAYQKSGHTFFDLIDEPSTGDSGSHVVRLRSGHRRLRPVPVMSAAATPLDHGHSVFEEIKRLYRPNEIYTWPPPRRAVTSNTCVNEVYGILNPDGHSGYVSATNDERSIIYATSEHSKGVKVLVYISFDPAAVLPDMPVETESPATARMNMPGLVGDSTVGTEDPTTTTKDSGAPLKEDLGSQARTGQETPVAEGDIVWAWSARAMHHCLRRKLAFGLPRERRYQSTT